MNFNLPERGPSEEPATEKQIEYIKHLAPRIKEQEVRQLGKWQASSLIDQLQDGRDSQRRPRGNDGNNKTGCGCIGPILVIVILCVVVAVIGECGSSTSEPEKNTQSPTKGKAVEREDPVKSESRTGASTENAIEERDSSRPGTSESGGKPQIRTGQRTWKDGKGKELQAALIRLFMMDGVYHGDFEKPDGSVFTYKIGNLSEDDVEFVKGLLGKEP